MLETGSEQRPPMLITFVAVVCADFFRSDSMQDAFSVPARGNRHKRNKASSRSESDLFSWLALALLFAVIWWFPEYARGSGAVLCPEEALSLANFRISASSDGNRPGDGAWRLAQRSSHVLC